MTFVCDICGFGAQFKFDIIIHLKDHQDNKIKKKIQEKVAGICALLIYILKFEHKISWNELLFFHKCIASILLCVKFKLVSMCLNIAFCKYLVV